MEKLLRKKGINYKFLYKQISTAYMYKFLKQFYKQSIFKSKIDNYTIAVWLLSPIAKQIVAFTSAIHSISCRLSYSEFFFFTLYFFIFKKLRKGIFNLLAGKGTRSFLL